MRVLITGATGFVGGYLAELLASERPEVEVFGLRRFRSEPRRSSARMDRVSWVEGDLLDAASILRAVKATRPDAILHLGASSSVASSWDTPAEMVQANVLGTLHLFEAMRQLDLDATIVVACSAEQYGLVHPDELPIREEQPFRPVSPYAVSKAAADLLAFQYFHAFKLRSVRLRLFNHCGPGQSDRFVIGSLTRQVVEIEAGTHSPQLLVGNLDVERDFVDVRDVARAYVAAMQKATPGEVYNVASGRSRSLREILDVILTMSEAVIEVSFDPHRLRPADVPALRGDPSKFTAATGWRATIPLEQTLSDSLSYWRKHLQGREKGAGE